VTLVRVTGLVAPLALLSGCVQVSPFGADHEIGNLYVGADVATDAPRDAPAPAAHLRGELRRRTFAPVVDAGVSVAVDTGERLRVRTDAAGHFEAQFPLYRVDRLPDVPHGRQGATARTYVRQVKLEIDAGDRRLRRAVLHVPEETERRLLLFIGDDEVVSIQPEP
jgi:hypothetical protein